MSGILPTRLSADHNSPFWSQLSGQVDVLLDGVVLERCVEADTQEGWADVMIVQDGYCVEIVRRFGKVTFRF